MCEGLATKDGLRKVSKTVITDPFSILTFRGFLYVAIPNGHHGGLPCLTDPSKEVVRISLP
jgi:hypothetical protein